MTRCPICDHANPPAAQQCEECGMELIRDRDDMGDDDPLQAAIAAGAKIEAIRLYRERTGASLIQAKDAVEALMRGDSPPAPTRTSLSSAAEQEILTALHDGRKIEAIKRYREEVGGGLKEAKFAVEALARDHGIEATGSGCLSLIVFGAFVTAVAGYALA